MCILFIYNKILFNKSVQGAYSSADIEKYNFILQFLPSFDVNEWVEIFGGLSKGRVYGQPHQLKINIR